MKLEKKMRVSDSLMGIYLGEMYFFMFITCKLRSQVQNNCVFFARIAALFG